MIHFSVRVKLSSAEAGFSSRLSSDRLHCALPPQQWKGRDCERAASPFNSALKPQGLCVQMKVIHNLDTVDNLFHMTYALVCVFDVSITEVHMILFSIY